MIQILQLHWTLFGNIYSSTEEHMHISISEGKSSFQSPKFNSSIIFTIFEVNVDQLPITSSKIMVLCSLVHLVKAENKEDRSRLPSKIHPHRERERERLKTESSRGGNGLSALFEHQTWLFQPDCAWTSVEKRKRDFLNNTRITYCIINQWTLISYKAMGAEEQCSQIQKDEQIKITYNGSFLWLGHTCWQQPNSLMLYV